MGGEAVYDHVRATHDALKILKSKKKCDYFSGILRALAKIKNVMKITILSGPTEPSGMRVGTRQPGT